MSIHKTRDFLLPIGPPAGPLSDHLQRQPEENDQAGRPPGNCPGSWEDDAEAVQIIKEY